MNKRIAKMNSCKHKNYKAIFNLVFFDKTEYYPRDRMIQQVECKNCGLRHYFTIGEK